jgi:hypothetical protein
MNQKWNLQDIRPATPRKKRSIEGGERVAVAQERPLEVESREDAEEEMSIRITDGNKKKSRTLWYALGVFVLVVGGALAFSALMGGADVTVYPKHREPNVNAEFEAKKVAQAGELPYEVMTLEAEGERQVKASGQEEVTTQAEGTIFIYNEQQTDPVRLVTNTRFESPDGLIFKIKDPAIVPGYTVGADGKKVPGVTTAEVYADETGEKYNLGPSKFTVPGFKGDPEYTTIYAESTSAFTGGFSGQKFIIDDAELQVAQQALQTELRNSLLTRVDTEKPAGFVVFKDAVTFTYESLPQVAYGDNLATIKEKALLRIPLFKEDDFAAFIAKATIPGYEDVPVRIADTSVFTFSYTDATTSSSDISNLTSLTFKLLGKPQIIWKYDAEKLKADLVNANKTALPSILGGYPAIERATAVIRPFWKNKFPTKIDDITINEVIEPQ